MKSPENPNQRLDAVINRLRSVPDPTPYLPEVMALIELGCDEAYYFAGCIYEEGGTEVKSDLEKALFYYQKSVSEYGYVEGYLALGRFYYYGIGVPKDYKKAFEYFSTVAESEDNPIANMMLGMLHQYGLGVDKSLNIAKDYYEKAVLKGNVYAIQKLAFLEEELGHRIKGLWLRLRAGITAYSVGRKNMKDEWLRRG